MSAEHRLSVRAEDSTAEITVYDGGFNRVGRGVGGYDGVHADGLYEIRVRTAGTQEQRLLSLAHDETVDIDPVAFKSPVPLAISASADEAHQAAVARASRAPIGLGTGSALLIVVRDRQMANKSPEGSPASGLSLLDIEGRPVFDVGRKATVDSSGRSPIAAVCLQVDPGAYRLRLDLGNGKARERSLFASTGWTTQCFMVRRSSADGCAADLAQGSLSLGRLGRPFVSSDVALRLGEAALDALANSRNVTQAATQALLNAKFEDPILGLLVGHLLLRDAPGDVMLEAVIANMRRLLGPEHPDVQALAVGAAAADVPTVVTWLPMLRASWDLIVLRTLTEPSLVPPESLAARLATCVLPSSPWLVWDGGHDCSVRLGASKMAALRGYLGGANASKPISARRASIHPEGLPAAADVARALGPPSPAVPSGALEAGDREALARSLGLTGPVLDEMLVRIGDTVP